MSAKLAVSPLELELQIQSSSTQLLKQTQNILPAVTLSMKQTFSKSEVRKFNRCLQETPRVYGSLSALAAIGNKKVYDFYVKKSVC